ncbi:SMI1/KNR4 family protein [Aquabacterium sp. A7-Y]|uniref:SMI1/KNR4 family protein n=1 Tax=Aquabacterium sp. A7-Y TaxID=1349605 RepID=UPI00223D8734|nr:SMI1/KNR4 family protein [Aquabacterium sp. A7-Y]MCW7540678.1 SMI1/KNR4 family protein [Aquabacterium sp. A7-Y]
MNELWDRLESLLERHAPEVLASLNPPASLEKIHAAEQALGVSFPEDVRTAYLRHNGAADQTIDHGPYFFYYGGWCSLDMMVYKWQSTCRLADDLKLQPGGMDNFPEEDETWADMEIRPEWWNPHRIPLSGSNTYNMLLVDLQPGPAGVRGQVLKDNGTGEPIVVARSLDELLTTMADRLEQGLMVWDPIKRWVNAATGTTILEWKTMWG